MNHAITFATITQLQPRRIILMENYFPLSLQITLLENHIESERFPTGSYWLHPSVYKLSCQQSLEAMKQPFTIVVSTTHEVHGMSMLHIRHYICNGEYLYYIDSVRPFASTYFVSSAVQFDGHVFRSSGYQSQQLFDSVEDAVAWLKA